MCAGARPLSTPGAWTAYFSGGDARQRAIRYSDREHGAFDELDPYACASYPGGSGRLDAHAP
jgi:hypothetical protein